MEELSPFGCKLTQLQNLRNLLPYEGKDASEPTTVWVLQDDANLYVAFRCKTPGRKPMVSLGGSEDGVTLYLDTFGNKTTAYKFWVGASGCHSDAMVLDDGRNTDRSWEGVWFYGVKVYPEAYEIEIKIPFKTIRYSWCALITSRRYLREVISFGVIAYLTAPDILTVSCIDLISCIMLSD
ncbi:MAG TPA: hypothetical protein EYP60_02475 [bacterium (Candidatus Stahlbacteria)]|nr:hypothetical protein [Candidatus Stahlbacteria bacterium]